MQIFLTVYRKIVCSMTISRRINFDELIPQMIERLKSEHVFFESKLVQVEDNINKNDIMQAAQIIQGISDKITHHAVEEEARLMRIIMLKAKEESAESVKIMQEHNWVMNFLKNRITMAENVSASSDPRKFEQAKNDLSEFVINLRKHFKEEEQIVFPLALESEAAGK
jgi:hemerythrin-like domain-containing protein